MQKKPAFIFFIFLNSLGNHHVTTGGTLTQPHPRVRVRAKGNAVYLQKTQVYLLRMRPREFFDLTTRTRLQGRLQIYEPLGLE